MTVVAEYPDVVPLALPVEEHAAQVIVLGDGPPGLDDECRDLLAAHPRVKLFVVGGDGLRTTLCELRPHREQLGEVAPEQLLALMRQSVSAASGGW